MDWIGKSADETRLQHFGLRFHGGGAHQSKTMMSRELAQLLAVLPYVASDTRSLIIDGNVLGKATSSAASSVYRNMASLYGLVGPSIVFRVLFGLWRQNADRRELLALLVALARDPLLRAGSGSVISATVGSSVTWPVIAEDIDSAFPGRFSPKMLRSLAQNCASTWTQSGHLHGKMKARGRIEATPEAAALAGLIADFCGFSGPAMLTSPWFQAIDLGPDAALDWLRKAESKGLARVRAAGDVIEISVRKPLSRALGVPELELI